MTKQEKLRHSEYYDLQKTYDELYEESKQNKIFVNLMELIANEDNILLAYRNTKRNAGSDTAGTDCRTIKDIEKLSTEKFIELVKRKLNRYKPKSVKRVEIPKPNGKTRPLGIATILDRIVQQCILQVLEPICEAKFFNRSYGFRPNRSAENAIAECSKMIQLQNLHFVVDIDIKGFFDNVNHTKLIKQMWTMGIRDKKLLCIIREMLKAPILMPDGETVFPTKGVPQGGIASPLFSNIVLNELDWWIASQWENMPTEYDYKCWYSSSGTKNKAPIYQSLRNKSTLKEVYIVRYADDFKLFCKKRSDANKIFIATKQWLNERLGLEISEEKSKIVNLKKHYSEFLGFKMKAVEKRKSHTVRMHMTDKAIQRESDKLVEQIKKIEHMANRKDEAREVRLYNSMIWGIHNYYGIATCISLDCDIIHRRVLIVMKNRLGKRLSKKGKINELYIQKQYGKSRQIRFIGGNAICPIGYVQFKIPMFKKKKICKYTMEGREEIHKNLKFDTKIMLSLMKINEHTESIEFADNRISLYAAQNGKCAVTGEVLTLSDIHCHHKKPKSNGGTDKYSNLVILQKDVHTLIHATQSETINAYLELIKPNKAMLEKINKLRRQAENIEIQQ